MQGRLDCLVRAAPQPQPRTAELAPLIAPDAFAGDEVLVTGGSRGLGEVSAKLLAAGGARVTITYAAGEADADRVAADIQSAGAECDVLNYRSTEEIEPLLDRLRSPPTHVYYFAAPRIAATRTAFFDKARDDAMQTFFVDGFWGVAAAVHARRADARLFYPSSVYVESPPRGLEEYAMAKAAGEVLCSGIARVLKPMTVVVMRLPQLATDQNLTSVSVRGGNPVDTLLPIVRQVQQRPA